MKTMHVVVATCAMLATASAARANLILINGTPSASFVDIGAQGFGNAPRMLTLQGQGSSDFESGAVIPVGGNAVVSGDAESGSNKSNTPTLAALGWTDGSQVGLGFNATEPSGNSPGAGVTLRTLEMTIFNGNTALSNPFSLASPITFSPA